MKKKLSEDISPTPTHHSRTIPAPRESRTASKPRTGPEKIRSLLCGIHVTAFTVTTVFIRMWDTRHSLYCYHCLHQDVGYMSQPLLLPLSSTGCEIYVTAFTVTAVFIRMWDIRHSLYCYRCL
ncbi:hypothetical protein ElyMa_005763200 [Elysia marginata]|uniref:G-protein coupled receptors family 1 profile domain-containing protein n=1 Tax=Elysia marginata TaxID=1093978 RepID=A0AAV4FMZ7_9GAST|nr:hypothetical protein ElyMa_005763200 [Elysia marginata]